MALCYHWCDCSSDVSLKEHTKWPVGPLQWKELGVAGLLLQCWILKVSACFQQTRSSDHV